jgi:hypothetical protein
MVVGKDFDYHYWLHCSLGCLLVSYLPVSDHAVHKPMPRCPASCHISTSAISSVIGICVQGWKRMVCYLWWSIIPSNSAIVEAWSVSFGSGGNEWNSCTGRNACLQDLPALSWPTIQLGRDVGLVVEDSRYSRSNDKQRPKRQFGM